MKWKKLKRKLAGLGLLGNLPEGDVAALVSAVLMAAARAAREDLTEIFKEMRKLQRRRREFALVHDRAHAFRCPVCGQDARRAALPSLSDELHRLVELQRTLSDKKDALGDLTMEEQARLRRFMEEQAQVAETISHVLKLASESAAQIARNLK